MRGSDGSNRRRLARRERAVLAAIGAIVATVLVVLLGAAPGKAANRREAVRTSVDRATTRAYLLARYEYARTAAVNAPATIEAGKAFVGSLEKECAGVLDGAPGTLEGIFSSGPPPSPRGRGKLARQSGQLDALRLEITLAEVDANEAPNRGAQEKLLAAEEKLHWSNPRVAALAAHQVAVERENLSLAQMSPSGVCADLLAWRASGFRALGASTLELQEKLYVRDARPLHPESLESTLKPYEGPSERALVQRTNALEERLAEALLEQSVGGHLSQALGLHEEHEEQEREVVAARGSTIAGDTYSVNVQPHSRSHRVGCAEEAYVQFIPKRQSGVNLVISSGGGPSLCLRGRQVREHHLVSCEEGLLTIATTVAPTASAVRLLLSDGRAVTTPAPFVPGSKGGPARIYVQAVNGPSPIPVSLTMLDSHGKILQVVPLAAVRNCRHPKPTKQPVSLTLAQGTAPGGRPFMIDGTDFTFAFARRTPLHLGLRGGPQAIDQEGSDEFGGGGPLSGHLAAECPPNGYAIIYGLLAAPAAAVTAVTPAGPMPLHRVPIPATLHARGALVYGVLPALPSQLLIEGPDGRTLHTIDLTRLAHEDAEFCEGYTEG